MKKVVALLLTVATVLAIVIVPTAIVASADEVPFTIEVVPVEGKYYAGDIVSVTVDITSNPGVGGFTVAVIDNPALVYVDYEAGETYGAPLATGTVTGKHQFVFLNAGGADIAVTGSLITLNFEVVTDAADFTAYDVDVQIVEASHAKALYENLADVDGVVYAKQNVSEFVGASVELTENFNVVYSAHIATPDDPSYARFTMNGYTYDLVEGALNDETGYFDYVFEGVVPQAIGDLITAELIGADETTVLDVKEGYSIREYCYNQMKADGASDELKTLLADILVYGAAAQVYADYATGDLVDVNDVTVIDDKKIEFAGLADLVAAYKSEYTPLTEDDGWDYYFDNDNGGTKITFNGAYVVFDSSAKLVINFTMDAALEPLSAVAENNGKYWLTSFSDGVNEYAPEDLAEDGDGNYELVVPVSMGTFSDYTMMDIAPTFKRINKSGTKYVAANGQPAAMDTLHYGIMCYAYGIQDSEDVDTAMKDLMKTLINYGFSAENYVASVAD